MNRLLGALVLALVMPSQSSADLMGGLDHMIVPEVEVASVSSLPQASARERAQGLAELLSLSKATATAARVSALELLASSAGEHMMGDGSIMKDSDMPILLAAVPADTHVMRDGSIIKNIDMPSLLAEPTTEVAPSGAPTTDAPTNAPTTDAPTNAPTTDSPSSAPSAEPSTAPSSLAPTTGVPSVAPTPEPSCDNCVKDQGSNWCERKQRCAPPSHPSHPPL